jgi:hypothetical protein
LSDRKEEEEEKTRRENEKEGGGEEDYDNKKIASPSEGSIVQSNTKTTIGKARGEEGNVEESQAEEPAKKVSK